MPSFQPYWGKPAVRNDRGDRGDVGIIRSPVRASILPDWETEAGDCLRPPGGCGNGATAEPVRHRQTKGAATDMFDLQPPRHISTLRNLALHHGITSVRTPEWPPIERVRTSSWLSSLRVVVKLRC